MTNSSDLIYRKPSHPGSIMERVGMRNRGMDFENLSSKSGVDVPELKRFAAGEIPMTETMRDKLRAVFGEAAKVMYRIQLSYDHFEKHGRRMPHGLRLDVE